MRSLVLKAVVLAVVLAGCSNAERTAGGPAEMAAAPSLAKARDEAAADAPGTMLAYEHHAQVRLEAGAIPQRLREAQEACTSRRFGECVVLEVSGSGGDAPSGRLSVRIVPAGVEPLIALASQGGDIGSRNMHAEDLAVAVRDNDRVQDRLRRELAKLEEFQQRRDLAVADMIALARQIAETEAQLQAAEQEGAQHRRRIDTQLLTLAFEPPGGQSGRNEIVRALADFGATLSMGTAWTIRALAFLIPLGLVLAVLVALWRRWRRRRRG